MKTLLSIAALIMLSISMMSCNPSKEQKSKIVDQYFNRTILFECKIVSLNEMTYSDSAKFKTAVYYVLAKDVYDAQRLFEDQLSELQNTLNGSEVFWTPVSITSRQDYPYIYQ
jgi:hypothetical protein